MSSGDYSAMTGNELDNLIGFFDNSLLELLFCEKVKLKPLAKLTL